ncbi:hypothetical protein EKK58_12905 [Candidatus Dependentiae bacterium]|nr:MAG: hypothetical protein EKK58_12905 [Candidatus Dependentiae bacterium]
MKYFGEIKSTNIHNGVVTINVSYASEDAQHTLEETYTLNSPQGDSWIQDTIQARIKNLEELHQEAQNIQLGLVSAPEPISEEELLYKKNLNEFNSLVSAFAKGIVSDTDEVFLQKQQWLKDNFQPSYIKYF